MKKWVKGSQATESREGREGEGRGVEMERSTASGAAKL